MTQSERVLAASKSFRGICQAELLGDDGTAPITRLAARIQNLEDQGHVFEILPDRKRTRVYRWVEGPEVERDAGNSKPPFGDGTHPPASVSLSSGKLFEVGKAQYGFEDQEMVA